jgi:cytosine deaminase
MSDNANDLKFMQAALEEARQGLQEGGIPIGAVLVRDGKIIGRGHNRRVQQGDPTAHAEIDCLRNAGRVGSYNGTVMYSTLMPCFLCGGAAALFRIPRVVAGENRTFKSSSDFMRSQGIDVVDMDLSECFEMMRKWIEENPTLWAEDIGLLPDSAKPAAR